MMHHPPRIEDLFLTRRDFLQRCGIGFGALGLATLAGPGLRADGVNMHNPLAPRSPHFPARAKRVIHIFANGGPSQVDTFDPKPELTKWHGKPLPLDLKTERKTGAAFGSPFKFQKYGQSGIEVSELFPHVAESRPIVPAGSRAGKDIGVTKKVPVPLTRWEELAQVLLLANELAFID